MSLFRTFRRYGFRRTLASLKWQTELPFGTSLSHRLRLLRGGFGAASSRTYALERNSPRDYLSDLASGSARTRRSNGPFAVSLFSDKLLSHALLGPHIALPELLALVEQGRLYPLRESTVADVESLLRYCEGVGSVILKPSQGKKGGGVFRLESRDGAFSLNQRAADRPAVAGVIASLDDYLVEACVVQAPYGAEIFPAAANTVRIVTLRDIDSGQPFIAAAIHKFGTEETAPTDNWTRGALSAPIDLQTGRLGRAVRNPQGKVRSVRDGGGLAWSAVHPDTGRPIEGVQLPHWEAVKAGVLRLTSTFDFLAYVGWDVLITDAGPCLIEGNTANVGVRSLQVHGPLLADPRVRRFFAFHNVIDPGITDAR